MRLYFRPSLGLVFLILTCLQVFGLYIFLKGFLLTRQTFDLQGHAYSSWERFPLHHPTQQVTTPQPINPKPAFKRTILILIDALRFDFVLDDKKKTTDNKYYLNQFPIIQHLHDTQPSSSLLFQFRADPPTTTMQRIKGLMTGSLPTFIDAGANFASSAVGEDHLLRHIKNKYDKIYFMGDDTWVNLFPETFDDPARTFDSDSFKMLDLDSVDNGILHHLWPLMEQEQDWEIAIAHFLGVDHCGHTYGPSDPNMKRKLNQMNGVIERILPQVDNETLLLVMGDHGMSVEGDHGGESVEELMSSLFMYSGRKLTLQDDYYQQLYNRIHQARSNQLGYDLSAITERLAYDATKYPVVAQIHLVPTLAYLLDVPIPFGNLGAVVPDVLHSVNDDNKQVNLLHMVEQFRMNALQVYDYLNQYSQQTHQLDFSKEKLSPITKHLYAAEEIMLKLMQQDEFIKSVHESVSSPLDDDLYEKQLEDAILEYDSFLINTIKYCEAIWAQFDTGCMFIGIVLLGFSTLTSIWLTMNKKELRATYQGILSVGLPVFVLGLSMMYLRYYVFFQFLLTKGWFEKMEKVEWIGASIVLTVCCVSLFTIRGKFVAAAQNEVFWYACDWYLVLVADLAQSFTLGSNSFVIWEDRGTRYMLATLSICWLLRNLNQQVSKESVTYPVLFMVLVRVISLTGQCREEQFPGCNYVHSGLLEFGYTSTGLLTTGFMIASLWMIYYFSQLLKRKSNNGWIVRMYQMSGSIVLLKIVQEVYSKNAVVEKTNFMLMIQKYLDVYLPRVVYGLCLTGTVVCIHQWFISKRKSKEITSVGWSILLLWSTVLAIVQRPFASLIVLGSPLFIHLLTRGALSSLLIRLVILHFLGHHLFFATGHQATFTSLPWKAAFVGFDEMSYYGGMILVTLSTTAGYIISWIGWFIVLTDTTHGDDAADIRYPLHLLTLLQSIPTFLCAIFILILRRHLMTWKIFAPRFLLQILLEVGSHFAAIILEKAL